MLKILVHSSVLSLCLITVIFVVTNTSHYGYQWIWILPLSFMTLYFLYYVLLNQKHNIFSIILTIVMFIRYVLLSFLLAYTNLNFIRSSIPPVEQSYNIAVLIMTIEMIVIFSTQYYFISKIRFNFREISVKPVKNKSVYILFIIIVLIGITIQPALWSRINFISPTEQTLSDEGLSIIGSITYFAANICRYLLIVLITSKFYKLYVASGSGIYILFNYLIAITLSLVVFGHNRADFLIGFLAVLFFLQVIYKNKAKIYNSLSIILAPLVVMIITSSRQFAESNLSFLEGFTTTLNAYFGGIYNVAIAIETRATYSTYITIPELFFDIVRPILGLNIFVRDMDFTLTNYLFNYRMHGTDHVSQIMPSVGHGYFFFGIIFSPLFSFLLLLLARYLMIKCIKIKKMDLLLLLLIPILRLTLSSVQNITIILNDLSSILVIFIALYFLNKIALRKNPNVHHKKNIKE